MSVKSDLKTLTLSTQNLMAYTWEKAYILTKATIGKCAYPYTKKITCLKVGILRDVFF